MDQCQWPLEMTLLRVIESLIRWIIIIIVRFLTLDTRSRVPYFDYIFRSVQLIEFELMCVSSSSVYRTLSDMIAIDRSLNNWTRKQLMCDTMVD